MYEHTQFGTVIIIIILSAISFSFWITLKTMPNPVASIVLTILIILLPLFYNLTVEVNQNAIRCSLGIGLISKTIAIDEVEQAHYVRNPWYFGWGIRSIPDGWMFNVSGFDAVELTLKSDNKFRIGTDDPSGLLSALSAIEEAKTESQ
jgi:hypothetical protein